MADAHGSGPCVRKDVRVQLPPRPLCSGPVAARPALSRWLCYSRGAVPPGPPTVRLGRTQRGHPGSFMRLSACAYWLLFAVGVGAVGGYVTGWAEWARVSGPG